MRDNITVAVLVHYLKRGDAGENIYRAWGSGLKSFMHSYQDGKPICIDKTHDMIFKDWWTERREGLERSPEE